MPGNDQSFDVDAYLRYIFGEENEPEQVGEQELHRPVQAPWPIGSDIGVTVLGSTIDILQRRCDEQFAIHRAKDPELLCGMIDDPPEEPPSPVLIESLMPRKEWAEDLCDSIKTKAACASSLPAAAVSTSIPMMWWPGSSASLAELTSPTK